MDIENVLIRLKKAIAFLKGEQRIHNQQDIVKALGYNKSSVSQALNNKNNYLTEDFVKKFADTFDISQDWLLFEKGLMTPTEHAYYKDTNPYSSPVLYEPQKGYALPADHSASCHESDLYYKDCKVIPSKLLHSLKDTHYSEDTFRGLRTERLTLTKNASAPWFKIEIQGNNMSNPQNCKDPKENLSDGSWVYCQIISKSDWSSEFLGCEANHPYCFFHNTVGIIVRNIAFYSAEKGELTLRCNHPDRALFPDITVKLLDCSLIGKVLRVLAFV